VGKGSRSVRTDIGYLQIDAEADVRDIKRAYARLSGEIHPEEKPEEFQRLYKAYQKALRYVSYRK